MSAMNYLEQFKYVMCSVISGHAELVLPDTGFHVRNVDCVLVSITSSD